MSTHPLLRGLARPGAIVPLLLAAALLALAFKLGDLGRVLGRVRAIPLRILLLSLAMAALYLALKCWQLRLLLANLGLRPEWRRFTLAFAVGELLVTLPLGIFAQNWILASTGSSRFGTSSAATVLMLAVETLVVLVFLALAGVPHWPEVRPAAALLAAGVVGAGFAVLRFEHRLRRLAQRARWPLLRRALASGLRLLEGLKTLSNWRIVGLNFALAALYLGALAIAFTAVGRGVGLHAFPYRTAASIYAVCLAAVLVAGGLVSQVGSVELLGMGTAHVWGIGFTDGLALMLGFRIVWTGTIWLLSLPSVLLLWRDAFRGRASAHDIEEAPD